MVFRLYLLPLWLASDIADHCFELAHLPKPTASGIAVRVRPIIPTPVSAGARAALPSFALVVVQLIRDL